MVRNVSSFAVAMLSTFVLAACGGGGGSNGGNAPPPPPPPPPPTFTVGGTLTGLSGSVVLQNSLRDDLTRTTNDAFTFATALAQGSAYSVSVKTQPEGQTCAVTNGSGNVTANVTNVAVNCSNNAPRTAAVAARINGLPGTSSVSLQNNEGEPVAIPGGTTLTFGSFAPGTGYSIAVASQPSFPAFDCTVANGAGTLGDADVTVDVNCAPLAAANLQAEANVKSVDLHWSAGERAQSATIYASLTRDCRISGTQNPCALVIADLSASVTSFLARVGVGEVFFKIETIHENGAHSLSTEVSARSADALKFLGRIEAILVLNDGTQYVGGEFTQVQFNDQPPKARSHLVALDTTGALLPWSPKIEGDDNQVTVSALAILGDVLYVGGHFHRINDQPAQHLAAILRSTGERLRVPATDEPWAADLGNATDKVRALTFFPTAGPSADRPQLYVGGSFTQIKDVQRRNLAAVDAADGTVLATFAPDPGRGNADEVVNSIVPVEITQDPVVSHQHQLYVGGKFFDILSDRPNRERFPLRNAARIDATTGQARGFSVDVTVPAFRPNPDGEIRALSLVERTLYMGGSFQRIRVAADADPQNPSGQVNGLAAVNFLNGSAKTVLVNPVLFAPIVDSRGPLAGTVNALVDSAATSQVYAGGLFAGSGGVPPKLAAFSRGDAEGAPIFNLADLGWVPIPAGNQAPISIDTLVVSPAGTRVYVGGTFDSLPGAPTCKNYCVLSAANAAPL